MIFSSIFKSPIHHFPYLSLGGLLVVFQVVSRPIPFFKFFLYYYYLITSAILWSSKKQLVVALSSTEAKYMAVTSTICQAI